MARHLLQLVGVTALLIAGVFFPYLPGRYDPLAVALSTAVQLLVAGGLVLVPIGLLWLAYEVRRGSRPGRSSAGQGGYALALIALIVGSALSIALSFLMLAGLGYSLGALALVFWLVAVLRLRHPLRRLRAASTPAFNPAPVYLVVVPLVALGCQVALARPALELSRNVAIQRSAEIIPALEAHRAQRGHYPQALMAVWPDYYPSVVGIAQYHYAPSGEAYNLAFEQPRLLFDNIGTREFVVYNPLDEHLIPSHAGWILIRPPQELAAEQGWYARHDTIVSHWQYFWFD
jgi:hypothetical protein